VNALFTRPRLEMDASSAQERLDPDSAFGELRGKDVLCLAGGGGYQSAAFGLLGAHVTVVDLSPEQLEHDRLTATHYGLEMTLIEGDMRDLSMLDKATFDLVFQPYSLNFVPDVGRVFGQVARVLRPSGIYAFQCANPAFSGLTERNWNGEGYVLKRPYAAGAEIIYEDQPWVYDQQETTVPPPREFRHTFDILTRELMRHRFQIEHISEWFSIYPDVNAEPGTWDHFVAFAPPWLAFRTRLSLD
jgi:SAM-dependent methyltransferase